MRVRVDEFNSSISYTEVQSPYGRVFNITTGQYSVALPFVRYATHLYSKHQHAPPTATTKAWWRTLYHF